MNIIAVAGDTAGGRREDSEQKEKAAEGAQEQDALRKAGPGHKRPPVVLAKFPEGHGQEEEETRRYNLFPFTASMRQLTMQYSLGPACDSECSCSCLGPDTLVSAGFIGVKKTSMFSVPEGVGGKVGVTGRSARRTAYLVRMTSKEQLQWALQCPAKQ